MASGGIPGRASRILRSGLSYTFNTGNKSGHRLNTNIAGLRFKASRIVKPDLCGIVHSAVKFRVRICCECVPGGLRKRTQLHVSCETGTLSWYRADGGAG